MYHKKSINNTNIREYILFSTQRYKGIHKSASIRRIVSNRVISLLQYLNESRRVINCTKQVTQSTHDHGPPHFCNDTIKPIPVSINQIIFV